jgi:hypothetical protein
MEMLLDCWEWLTCGPELRVVGLYMIIAVLFGMIVHRWKIVKNPNSEE